MNRKIIYSFIVAIIFSGLAIYPVVDVDNDHGDADADPELEWYSMEEAQKLAKENNKKVFVFGQADWCHYCKKMKKEVFTQQKTIELLNKHFYPVELTVDSDEKIIFNGDSYTMSHLSGMLGINQTPTLFFVRSDGEFIAQQPGFMPSDIFNQMLTYIGADIYKEKKFPEFYDETQR